MNNMKKLMVMSVATAFLGAAVSVGAVTKVEPKVKKAVASKTVAKKVAPKAKVAK